MWLMQFNVVLMVFDLFMDSHGICHEGLWKSLSDSCVYAPGTLFAACELMKKLQAEVLGCLVVIELKELSGVDKLKPHSVFSLVQY